MTEQQVVMALHRAASTDMSDEDRNRLMELVTAFDPSVENMESALLAGFCLGYDSGREDERIKQERQATITLPWRGRQTTKRRQLFDADGRIVVRLTADERATLQTHERAVYDDRLAAGYVVA